MGNALLYLGQYLQALLYSSLACAIASTLLNCVGLHSSPLNLGPGMAACCLVLLQLLVQPLPLGGWWALCTALVLLFLAETRQLLSSLAHGTLPGGFFAFLGYSHLLWLSPLMAAMLLAGALLMWHYMELLIAVSRGGYYLFCPPNPGLHSLDTLAADAVAGRPLSFSPRMPLPSPAAPLLSHLCAAEVSPRRLGAAMAQQRRTVGGPIASGETFEPSAHGEEARYTPREKDVSLKGAWLVALWLRGPFLLAALGCVCVTLSLLLLALAADTAAAATGSQGRAQFEGLTGLLLPQQQQKQQQSASSFLALNQQQQRHKGMPLAPQQQQGQQGDALLPQATSGRSRGRRERLHVLNPYGVLQPSASPVVAAVAADTTTERSQREVAAAASSFADLRIQERPHNNNKEQKQRQKTAAALMLLAMVLLLPLTASSLGEWMEGTTQGEQTSRYCRN